jgi:hypothetical protein
MDADKMKIYVCKNCGITRSQTCYNCENCGFYDYESEGYHKKIEIEKSEIDKINHIFFKKLLLNKGFKGIEDYDKFLGNEAKKHALFIISLRLLVILIGLFYFFHKKLLIGIIIGAIGWFISLFYRWNKFGHGDKMDEWNLLWNKERCISYHILSRYKDQQKLMGKEVEHELYL